MSDLALSIAYFKTPLGQGLATASGQLMEKTFAILRLCWGIHAGYGELSVSPSLKAGTLEENILKIQEIAPSLTSQHLSADSYFADLAERIGSLSPPARAALSTAAINLKSKICEQPVYELLGLPKPSARKSCYTIGRDEDSSLIDRDCFFAFKIKSDLGTSDLERLKKLQNSCFTPLWLDAESATQISLSPAEVAQSIQELDVILIEDPFKSWPPQQSWRASMPNTLVFADKAIDGIDKIEAAAGYVDGVVIKPLRLGGILPSCLAMSRARELGLKTILGCYVETDIALSAWLQLSSLADFVDLDGSTRLAQTPWRGLHHTQKGIKVDVLGQIEGLVWS